jgi:hypothetical protein
MTDEDRRFLTDLRQKLQIDQFDLETECCKQPIIYDEVGEWVASIKAVSRTAKEHVSFVESDLILRIRRNPAEFSIPDGKLTVDVVNSCVKTNLEYTQAFQEYVEAERLANEAITLLESVAERKSSVRDLVRLYIAHYYEKTDELNKEEWEHAQGAIEALRRKKAIEEDSNEDNVEEE